jgi:hypothetical protein
MEREGSGTLALPPLGFREKELIYIGLIDLPYMDFVFRRKN